MPRRKQKLTYTHSSPAAVASAVARLGANIATARLRRRWRQEDLARKAGLTRATVVAIEQGKLGTGIGAYVAVLWAMGLHGEVERIAAPDVDIEGRTLEDARLARRAHPSRTLSDEF